MSEKSKPDLRLLNSELDGQQDGGSAPDPGKPPVRLRGEVFPGCMVQALGVDGSKFFYLDVLGQLRGITRHDKEAINGLFASNAAPLYANFPRYSDGEVRGWNGEEAREALMRACAEKGVWNAFERVRGPGAWRDSDGGLILHAGDGVYRRGTWKITGEHDGFVYPAAPRIRRPVDVDTAAQVNACQELADEALDLYRTWNWQHAVAPRLLMGWTAAALVGGALKWRPMAWLSGDKGMGKSTLQDLIHEILGGDGASLRATDATEPSIRQMIGSSSMAVCLDEQEASSDNSKLDAIVKLARQASSGGLILRGGVDHKGQSFLARNCFLFSSILVPPLKDQDLSRIAVLNLLRLPKGATPPEMNPERHRQLGAAILALIVARWPLLQKTLDLYGAQLAREGYSARAQDQYGTLLALSDLVMFPDPITQERAENGVAQLGDFVQTDATDESAGYEKMFAHLCQQPVQTIKGGSQVLVGEMIEAVLWPNEEGSDDHGITPARARKELQRVGVRVYGIGEGAQLAIANAHANLATYFQATRWRDGVWRQECDRIPGVESTNPISFGVGAGVRARRFPIASIPNFFAAKAERQHAERDGAPYDPETDFA